MIKRETYMSKIRPFIDKDIIKVLTGIRRCGKSVMLKLIQEELIDRGVKKEQIIYINFEDKYNDNLLTGNALHEEIHKRASSIDGKVYLLFDEIQDVVAWEKCLNSLRVNLNCDIYITGSNAKLLSGELATYIAGRYKKFVIYPLSFKEFIDMYTTVDSSKDIRSIFSIYLQLGGMPFLGSINYEEEPCMEYLQDIYNSIELKDIIARNNIRDVDMLDRIISYVNTNVGNTFSATSISKYLKNEYRSFSPETVLNYLKACTDAYLFYQVKREDTNTKKLLSVNEKYYVADHGLRNATKFMSSDDINLTLENIVYLELVRRGYLVTVGKVGNKEIDFIATKPKEKIYIQVTYLLASPETIQREFDIYNDIKDNYPKYVVSMDEFDMSRNGIKHMNIRDFLLQDKWN